jgi:hypothetical protein
MTNNIWKKYLIEYFVPKVFSRKRYFEVVEEYRVDSALKEFRRIAPDNAEVGTIFVEHVNSRGEKDE